jgi:uncharacterized protein YecT (DUF1311 family)
MAGAIILLWFRRAELAMRAIVLAIVALGVGLAHPACAESSPASDRPIAELLPLFDKNHCSNFKDPAEQIFCGDPQLVDEAEKMNTAIRERLNRVPDRRHAIEENAQWIRERNSSCGIFGRQAVRSQDINSVKTCLLQETEERIAILDDPNFDCLATNTTAGALICSEPSLAIADKDLGDHVVALIAKLRDDDATRDAFAEYGRWTRSRDRKCGLVGKDNVPLEELTSSEDCLADSLSQKTAEVVAAKGDPKRIFGKNLPSPSPDADAVDACVGQIHLANACQNFIRVSRVTQIDSKVSAQDALVTAEVEMVVLSPFAACSPIASGCTGTCWDLKSGKAGPPAPTRDSFAVAHRVKIEKSFAFQKIAGGWRCSSAALQPVDLGIALSGGP